MIRSLQEVDTLNMTIKKVDLQITKMQRAIRRNLVPNVGIARKQLEMLVRQNNERKAYLRYNRGQIEALYQSTGGRFTPLRNSFITPDGPKYKGDKRKPFVSINDMKVKTPQTPALAPPPSQIKKQLPPPPEVIVTPRPISVPSVIENKQALNRAADNLRQEQLAIQQRVTQAVKQKKDAIRDAELTKQGKVDLVMKRRQSEKRRRLNEQRRRQQQTGQQRLNDMVSNAQTAVQRAQQQAQRIATDKASRRQSTPVSPPVSRNLLQAQQQAQQQAQILSQSDKKRTQNINQAIRSKSEVNEKAMKEQFTEDSRQAKPQKVGPSEEFNQFLKQASQLYSDVMKEIQQAKAGKGSFGFHYENLGTKRGDFWVNKAQAFVTQLYNDVKNDLTRWEQGALSAGVAVSTDSRSQAKRKMSMQEFEMYIQSKYMPKVEEFMNQLGEESRQAFNQRKAASQPKQTKVALKESLDVGRQRILSAADKARSRGRPVQTEQQGRQSQSALLGSLFPALRSSMQGVLRK
jgi:hypothetical protein